MFQNNSDIKPFEKKVWLASPTMHGEEQKYVNRAFELNWITTAGENVNEVERITAEYIGREHAVALSAGTAALHMAIKLAGEELYGKPKVGEGTLAGRKVFCSDVTFDATVNPVVYEGGEPVFIDTEYDTWNMDPVALEKAFDIYPEVKLVVLVNLYGTPAKLEDIKAICDKNGAILIEDAAESMGAKYKGKQTGTFGTYSIVSFNGNKIITGKLKNQKLEVKPGITDIINSLCKNGVSVAIVTSASEKRAKDYLKSVGLDYLFDLIISTEMPLS